MVMTGFYMQAQQRDREYKGFQPFKKLVKPSTQGERLKFII
jgi:hypothetical protein